MERQSSAEQREAAAERARMRERPTAARADMWASIIRLDRQSPYGLQGDAQRQVHAAFLRWLQEADSKLTDALHKPHMLRPYTLAILPERRGQHPGENRWGQLLLRCTLLHRWIFEAFAERTLMGNREEWRIKDTRFAWAAMTLTPEETGWSGWASFDWLLETAKPVASLRLEFVTPTAFSFGDVQIEAPVETREQEVAEERRFVERKRMALFPEPELVWQSWVQRWNAFCPDGYVLAASAVVKAAQRVLVADYGLRTATLDYGRFPQKGFTGWVRYDLTQVGDDARRILKMLAAFAFYGGTGYKTAQGMGQTRSLDDET